MSLSDSNSKIIQREKEIESMMLEIEVFISEKNNSLREIEIPSEDTKILPFFQETSISSTIVSLSAENILTKKLTELC